MDADQAFDYIANVTSQGIVGVLVAGAFLMIGRIYMPNRARMHYAIAGIGVVLYVVGIALFQSQSELDLRRFFLTLALLFVVFYGYRTLQYLHAIELQLSHLRKVNSSGPMECTIDVNIGGVVYQCQRYQYHRGQHEVITHQGTIKWTGVL